MSILIKGISMPENCKDCIFCVNDWCVINSRLHRTKEETTNVCPLVELPPHGRLIDADALMNSLPMEYPSVVMAISDAPTIIKSEEEE